MGRHAYRGTTWVEQLRARLAHWPVWAVWHVILCVLLRVVMVAAVLVILLPGASGVTPRPSLSQPAINGAP
jgi:hypothetical protein